MAQENLTWYGANPPRNNKKEEEQYQRFKREAEWYNSHGLRLGELLKNRGYPRAKHDREVAADNTMAGIKSI